MTSNRRKLFDHGKLETLMEGGIIAISDYNCKTLLRVRDGCASIQKFLAAEKEMQFQACGVGDVREFCTAVFDFDGIVMELEALEGLMVRVNYIKLPTFASRHLKPAFGVMKKHLDLAGVRHEAMQVIKSMLWVTLAMTDGGFFVSLLGAPSDFSRPNAKLSDYTYMARSTLSLLNAVLDAFKDAVRCLPASELSRPSFQKTCLSNLDHMNLLPQDQQFVFGLLDQSICSHGKSHELHLRVTLSKFGMKDPSELDLSSIVDIRAIQRLSIHAACTVVPHDPHINILWARDGLKDMLSHRGTTYAAIGMKTALNWQSRLDGREVWVCEEIRRLFRPDNVTFLQLYCGSPHLYVPSGSKHPVSGTIVTCGLLHHQRQKAMESRAQSYIRHMEDLMLKLSCQLKCRMEIVAAYDQATGLPSDPQKPRGFFVIAGIRKLLEEKPVLLSFRDRDDGTGLRSVCREAIQYIIDRLRTLHQSSSGRGGFSSSWEAYQMELALESFFFGRALSAGDILLSARLGTSTHVSRSLTHRRGFLGLRPHQRISASREPPPLRHWVTDEQQVSRIERVFPLSDCLGSGTAVVGEQLLLLLLKDLYNQNDSIPIQAMASGPPPGTLNRTTPLDQLCVHLATRDTFPAPLTFARARKMVCESGLDVCQSLRAGFDVLCLQYFPDIKYTAVRNARRVTWDRSGFMEVLRPGDWAEDSGAAVTGEGEVIVTQSGGLTTRPRRACTRAYQSQSSCTNSSIPCAQPPPLRRKVTWSLSENSRMDSDPAVEALTPSPDDDEIPCAQPPRTTSWSPLEQSLVDTDPSRKTSEAYSDYLMLCRAKNVPPRTWCAYETKRRRLLSQ